MDDAKGEEESAGKRGAKRKSEGGAGNARRKVAVSQVETACHREDVHSP